MAPLHSRFIGLSGIEKDALRPGCNHRPRQTSAADRIHGYPGKPNDDIQWASADGACGWYWLNMVESFFGDLTAGNKSTAAALPKVAELIATIDTSIA